MSNTFTSEKEVWGFFRGPQGREAMKEICAEFKKQFPKGHRTSIRELVELCTYPDIQKHFGGNNRLERMSSFHPRALSLLLAYGQDYTPRKWKKPPEFPEEPKWAGCFQNAHFLMRCANYASNTTTQETSEFVYAEGLVHGGSTLPMLHAWNAPTLNSNRAIDWSWYTNSHWFRYFGIPLTQEEHSEVSFLIDPKGKKLFSFLHKKYFEKVEYHLHTILARREEARMQEKLLGT